MTAREKTGIFQAKICIRRLIPPLWGGEARHIMPECAIGYKKLAQEMTGSPMILGVWSIRKKVPVKFLTSPF